MSRTIKDTRIRVRPDNVSPLCIHCGELVDTQPTTFGGAPFHRSCLDRVQREWEATSPPDDVVNDDDDDDDGPLDNVCPSCNGTGDSYDGMSATGGTCWECGGSGDHTRPWSGARR
jgi:hypothetical protein